MLIRDLFARSLRTAMAGVVMFVWCVAPAFNAVAATDEERAVAFSGQLQASLLALEDGDRDAARDRWDPQYVVDTIGIEPMDLFNWVRTSVIWMPYPGTLRGPEGVLMDRVGNSLDQSLLLATLLKLAGHDVRLAHAKLPDGRVDSIWAELQAGRQAPASPAAADVRASAPAVPADGDTQELVSADLYGIDRTAVANVIDTTSTEASSLSASMTTRITDQTARLADLVGPLDDEAISGAVLASTRASLADHWWVQVQESGSWTDFDLLAPGEAGGNALAPAAETMDPANIPADLQQRVVIRVIAEQLKDGKLSEHMVLEQAVKPHDLLGSTLGFRHFPMAWPEQWPQVTPDDIQIKLRAALYAQTEWLPVLVAGDAVLGTVGVFDTGEIDPSPHPVDPFMQMTVGMMGMISKATDALATGGDPDKLLPNDPTLDEPRAPRPEGELVSERLEYEIQRPGDKPRTISRELFDLIGGAARAKGDLSGFTMSRQKALDRSMAMLGESEIQILPSRLAPEFLTHLGAQNALGNRPVLDELARDPFGKLPANFMELFSKLNGMPAALYSLASLRFDINPFGDWVYVDRPSIVAQHTRLIRAGGGDFLAQVSLDIVENGVGVDPMAAANGAMLRMSQGIADTNAEAVALTKVGKVIPNTADAFSTAADSGVRWRMLRPGDQQFLGNLGYSSETTARLTQQLRGGALIIVPPRPTEGQALAGWWQIDPSTGTTLGIGPSGHGQAMVEYALIIIIEATMAAAQCALEASLTKALERTLAEKAKGSDSAVATGAGARAGFEQAAKDLGNTHTRNHCLAMGMFVGFKSLLLGFAMHAVKTAGDKGYDGSKRTNSYERNAVNNARNAPSKPNGGPPRAPNFPSNTPTKPGIGEQRQPRTPTTPGLGEPGQPRSPNSPGGQKPPPGGPPEEAATNAKPSPSPHLDDTMPAQQSPRDRFLDAQRRAEEAQDRLVQHKPIDTPEGLAETDKLWNDLDRANRDRIRAWDSMPRNQRPLAIPPVPPPKGQGGAPQPGVNPLGDTLPPSGDFGGYKTGEGPPAPGSQKPGVPEGEFGGYKTGEGPPSQVPPTEAAPGQGKSTGTHEAPPTPVPTIPPASVPPQPSVDDLMPGFDKRKGEPSSRPVPQPSGEMSVEDLLSGFNKGPAPPPVPRRPRPPDSSAPPQPPTPAPPPPKPAGPSKASEPAPSQELTLPADASSNPVPLPPPALPKPKNGNSGLAGSAAPEGAEAAKNSGLAGLTGALEMVSKP